MRIQSFNMELTYANICFARLFRNITINRHSNDSDKVEPVKVMCVLGTRTRILKALENQQEAADFTLPLIAITRTGMQRDSGRLSNLHNEIRRSVNGRINYDLITPNPIDINYRVTIFARYQSDIDLILSNWIPFFNNDVWISTRHYKYTDLKFSCQIVMSDSISENKNESPSNSDYDFYQAECNFTFKTVLFGGNRRVYSGIHSIKQPITTITTVVDPNDPSNVITTIITTPTDDPNKNDTDPSAEGFIPIIQRMHMELHAVPRYDPYIWDKYHVIRYLDIGTYFQEVDGKNGYTSDDGQPFITDPEFDSLDWVFQEMSAEVKQATGSYQWKWN